MIEPSGAVRAAVVPAAGLGTRLLPATLALAKELLPLGRYPALCATLLEAAAAELDEIVFVLSPGKEDLRRFLDPETWGPYRDDPRVQALRRLLAQVRVRCVLQPEPHGVLDAIARGMAQLPGPCAILFPDLIHLPDQRGLPALLDAHAACGEAVYGLYDAGAVHPERHGPSVRVILHEDQPAQGPRRIARVEPATASAQPGELRTTFGTIHTAAFTAALEAAARPARDRPFSDGGLVSALNLLAARGQLYGVQIPGEIIDIGVAPGYLDAARRFAAGEAGFRGLNS